MIRKKFFLKPHIDQAPSRFVDVTNAIIGSSSLSRTEIESTIHSSDGDGTGRSAAATLGLELKDVSWLWRNRAAFDFRRESAFVVLGGHKCSIGN